MRGSWLRGTLQDLATAGHNAAVTAGCRASKLLWGVRLQKQVFCLAKPDLASCAGVQPACTSFSTTCLWPVVSLLPAHRRCHQADAVPSTTSHAETKLPLPFSSHAKPRFYDLLLPACLQDQPPSLCSAQRVSCRSARRWCMSSACTRSTSSTAEHRCGRLELVSVPLACSE